MTLHLDLGRKKADEPPWISGEKLNGLDEQSKALPETILRRWTIAGVILTIVLTGLMSALTWLSTRQGEQDTDWVMHTLTVQNALQSAVGHAINAEAPVYAATGDETFLDPDKDRQHALARDLDTLRHLTADNPTEQSRLDRLGPQVAAGMESEKKIQDQRQRTGAPPSASELVEDKLRMDAVKATLAEMQGEEAGLLILRMGRTQQARHKTRIIAVFSALIGVVLMVLAGAILLREIARSARMRTQVKTLNIELLKLATDLESRVVERTRQLETTMVELRHKNEEVEAFVYIVSHDMRAPLVNLMGFARELQAGCERLKLLIESCVLPDVQGTEVFEILNEDLPSSVHFVSQSSLKFERLIDALLDLSRYGRQIYRIVESDAGELVASAVANFQQAITEAGATVKVGRLPSVRADFTALGQVFANLIGNSLKYRSPDRPLRLEVGGAIEDGTVNYWVRDNGLGIPEASKSRLFQVFQRFHPQRAQGEGMGLAIAHRIVERHGGKIWAESREDEGTTFHFSLPGNGLYSIAGSGENVIQEAVAHGSY
jgi:signal transduction histidine kinase